MAFSVAGVPDLDNRLMGMRAAGVLEWLRQGFALLSSDDLTARADAFPPLVLAPERELLAQLTTALREAEAEAEGLRSAERLRSVVIDHVADTDAVRNEAAADLTRMWQLLASLGCEASIFATGRAFLAELLRTRPPALFAEGGSDRLRALVGAVVAAIATSSPMGPYQLSVLEFVRRNRELWSEDFVDLIVDCAFSVEARSPRHGPDEDRAAAARRRWVELREGLGNDLEERADPRTPVGRALIRSLARYVWLDVRVPSGREGAEALRAALWAIGLDEAEPPTVDMEPSRELELEAA